MQKQDINLYLVTLNGVDSPGSKRLVAASGPDRALWHIAQAVFSVCEATALQAAQLAAEGTAIEYTQGTYTAPVSAEPVAVASAYVDVDVMPQRFVSGVDVAAQMSPEVAERERLIRESPEVQEAIRHKKAAMLAMRGMGVVMEEQAAASFLERDAVGQIISPPV